ncbi:MAG: hypothetical protein JSS25_03605, partial [Proteobacteria bacterium]|nr:hypothetical protein [Pseudomonadota bacterium]
MKRQTWLVVCSLVLAACQPQTPPAQENAKAKPSVEIPNTPEAPPKPGAEATPDTVLAAREAPVEQVAPAQPLLPPGDCSYTL